MHTPLRSRLALPLLLVVTGSLVAAASASANNYCVVKPATTLTGCSQTFIDDVQAGIAAANSNAGPDQVTIGAGTFTSNVGTGLFIGSSTAGNTVTIAGQGPSTVLANSNPANSFGVIDINSSAGANAIRDLAISLPGGTTPFGGVRTSNLSPTDISNVVITAPPTQQNSFGVMLGNGSTFRSGSITLPLKGPYGGPANSAVDVRATTPATPAIVRDSTLTGDYGVELDAGPAGFEQHARLSELSISATIGVTTGNGGTATVENSLIRLLPALGHESDPSYRALGLNASVSTPNQDDASITADGVTVIGGAGAGDTAFSASSNVNPSNGQANMDIDNSIAAGVETSLDRSADGPAPNGGLASMTVSYSDYDPAIATDANFNDGGGFIFVGPGNVNVNPGFAAPGIDYRLAAASPLIDAGRPGALPAGASTTDLAGGPRLFDGNGDGTARRDIGAYEFQPAAVPPGDTTPPDTLAGKFKKKVKKKSATFKFSAEAGATFACKLDEKASKACSSPYKAKRLKRGKHVLLVTATDAAGNADPTPARFAFKVKKKTKNK